MVMHARKQPRLNDGYSDRKDAHLHQDMQYHSGVFTDNTDDNGPLSSRDSPRYQNKSSYIERNKEKRGSLSLSAKKVSHYLATGSLGRPIPMESNFPVEGEGQQNTTEFAHRSSASSSSSQHHTSGLRKERSSSQGERTCTNTRDYSTSATKPHGSDYKPLSSHYHSSEQSQSKNSSGTHHHHISEQNSHHEKDNSSTKTTLGNSGKQNSKDKEVQKSAIRVCGDWSEHISSSGKRYYYNCKTEVSQWEKPKEWNSEMCKTPDHRSKDSKPRMLSHTPVSKINPDSRSARHSIGNDQQQQHDHSRSHHRVNSDMSESSRDSFHLRDNRDFKESQMVARENQQSARENKDCGAGSRDQVYKLGYDKSRPGDPSVIPSSYQVYTGRTSTVLTGNNGLPVVEDDYNSKRDGHMYGDGRKLSQDISHRRRTDSQGSQRCHDISQDTMDISPSSSLSPSQPGSVNGTSQLPVTANAVPPASVSNPSGTTINIRSSSPQGNPIPTLVNRQTVAAEGGNFDKKTNKQKSTSTLEHIVSTENFSAIQTLQELHKALSMSIHRAQQGTTSTGRPTSVQLSSLSSSSLSSLRHHLPTTQLTLSHSATSQMGPSQSHQSPQFHPGHPVQASVTGPPTSSQTSPYSGSGMSAQPHPSIQQQGLTHQGSKEEDHNATGGRASPVSETSRSSSGSPTPSDTSSQNAAISQQALNAAVPMKNEETAKLTASLSNYYNESLIGHVLGWQADALEKQASKLWEETMVNGSLQCSQISVDLKKARSLVRIAEIQSTLHEQRIMSSDQQRQEIENLKTPSSFLPS